MRYLLSFVLALQISFFVCISSYAAGSATASDAVKVASGSETVKVASGSEASRPSMLYSQVMDSVALYSDSDISLLSDSDLPSVSNTVDYHDLSLCVQYYDMSNNSKTKSIAFDSNYYASLSLPDDCAKPYRVFVRIGKSSLPASGRYNMQIYFGSNTGVSYGKFRFFTAKNVENAAQVSTETESLGTFTQSSGDWYYSVVLELGNVSYITAGPYLSVQSNSFFPYGGFVKVNFRQTSSDPVFTSAGGSYTSADAASDTANNTAQIVEKQDEVIDQIVATTETISMQISAFWNQLAGELTNLFNKMNEHHQEDLDKVDEQIENDNANTQEVTGAIEKHGNFIIEGLKSLFIPSDQFFKDYFDDLYDWFSDRFGFLSFPIDLLIRLADMFINSSEVDCVLTLPSFSVMDQELWPDMSFNFTDFLNENFLFLLTAIRTVSSIGLIMAFVSLCERKWEEVMLN